MSNYTLFRIVVCRNPLHGAYYTKSTVVMKATDGLEIPKFYFGLPNLCDPLRGFGKTPTVAVLATAPLLRAFQP